MATQRTLTHPDNGTKQNRWTVVDNDARHRGNKRAYLCRCDCGTEKVLSPSDFLRERTKSCGCLNAELSRTRATKHGQRYTKLHGVWLGMKQRCSNPRHVSYLNYGNRGIKVCDEWTDYAAFRTWAIAAGYVEGAVYRQEIDRIDNDGDYSPENCEVVRPRTNRQHTRASRDLAAFGETKSMGAWADDPRCAVSYHTLRTRINRGWPVEKSLTEPPHAKGDKRQRRGRS